MDFGKAFSFQFEDPDWIKKILLSGLIALIPVVGQFYLTGWMMEIAGRFAKDDTVLLPDINFGEYLKKGFLGAVVGFVYGLPAFVVMLPAIIISAVASNNADLEWLIIGSMVCCGGLGVLIAIATSLLSLVAILKVQLSDFKAAFDVKHNFQVFKNAIGPYLLTIVVAALALPIISSLGAVLCGIGVLFTMPYGLSLYGSCLGQAYKIGIEKTQAVEF